MSNVVTLDMNVETLLGFLATRKLQKSNLGTFTHVKIVLSSC